MHKPRKEKKGPLCLLVHQVIWSSFFHLLVIDKLHISCVPGLVEEHFLSGLSLWCNGKQPPWQEKPKGQGLCCTPETLRQWKAHLPGIGLISSGELDDGIQKTPIMPAQFHYRSQWWEVQRGDQNGVGLTPSVQTCLCLLESSDWNKTITLRPLRQGVGLRHEYDI